MRPSDEYRGPQGPESNPYTAPPFSPFRRLLTRLAVIVALFVLSGLALHFLWHLPGWGVFIILLGTGVAAAMTYFALVGDPLGPR